MSNEAALDARDRAIERLESLNTDLLAALKVTAPTHHYEKHPSEEPWNKCQYKLLIDRAEHGD